MRETECVSLPTVSVYITKTKRISSSPNCWCMKLHYLKYITKFLLLGKKERLIPFILNYLTSSNVVKKNHIFQNNTLDSNSNNNKPCYRVLTMRPARGQELPMHHLISTLFLSSKKQTGAPVSSILHVVH